MSAPIRIRKARFGGSRRPWVVRHHATILGRYPTGEQALDFVRRLIRAAE